MTLGRGQQPGVHKRRRRSSTSPKRYSKLMTVCPHEDHLAAHLTSILRVEEAGSTAVMARRAQSFQVERQITQIVQCLFADDDDDYDQVDNRQFDADLETDGPETGEENFDPVPIANKLKEVAKSLNEDANFKAALADLQLALRQEAMEAAFSSGVDSLLRSQIALQATDVATEMQLIAVCFAFGLFVKKSCPELKTKAQSAVTSLLRSRVATWVTQQGGWALSGMSTFISEVKALGKDSTPRYPQIAVKK